MSKESSLRFGRGMGGKAAILSMLLFAAVMGVLGSMLAKWLRGPQTLSVVEYPMQEKLDIPTAVAVAADGTVWFTIDSSDALGVIKNGKMSRIFKGSRNVEALGLGVDSSGNAWVADAPAVAIKRVTPAGEITAVPLGTAIARLGRLTVGPDDSVWFAESTAYSITRLKDGVLKRHDVQSLRGGPFGVAMDANGNIWAALQSGNMLLRIAADGTRTEHELPTPAAYPTDVAVDAKGRPWFIEFRGNKVGVLQDGRIIEYPLPVENAALSGITVAPDGAVWFGMLRSHALGRVRDGKLVVLPFPRKDARPFTVAADKAGNIWYADISGFVGMVPADFARR
jgi:virginiamycin B lyase